MLSGIKKEVATLVLLTLGLFFLGLRWRSSGLHPVASFQWWIDLVIGVSICSLALFLARAVPKTMIAAGGIVAIAGAIGLSLGGRLANGDFGSGASPQMEFITAHGFGGEHIPMLQREDGPDGVKVVRYDSDQQKRVLGYFDSADWVGAGPIRVQKAGKENCLDANGKVYFEWKYQEVMACFFINQPIIVKHETGYELVKMDGAYLRTLKEFDLIGHNVKQVFNPLDGLLTARLRGGRVGFVDLATGYPGTSFEYEVAKPMVHKLGLVKKTGRWGVIDVRGEWILKPRFDEAEFCEVFLKELGPPEGVWALEGKSWGLYDITEKRWIISAQLPEHPLFNGGPGTQRAMLKKSISGWTYDDKAILPSDRWEIADGAWLVRSNK